MILITLGLCLSVYQEDLFTFIYQFMMQGLLYFSMKDTILDKRRGQVPKTVLQGKICKVIIGMLVFLVILKSYYIIDLGIVLESQVYIDNQFILSSLGFNFLKEGGTYRVLILDTLQFEIIALSINFLLLKYYIGQADVHFMKQKFNLIHNTMFLRQYMKLQNLFYFFLMLDTLFSQTFIQLIILCCTFTILILWSKDQHTETTKKISNRILKISINIQLASFALFQIYFLEDWVRSHPVVERVFYAIGILFNYEVDGYVKVCHTFLLCLAIATGQFYTAVRHNFQELPPVVQDVLSKQGNTLVAALSNSNQFAAPKAGNLKKAAPAKVFDSQAFIKQYLPFACIWICRVSSIIIAYAYDGYGGFVVLSWLLLSFIVKLEKFSEVTQKTYMWFFILAFLYEFLINIQGLFIHVAGTNFEDVPMPGVFEDVPRFKIYSEGQKLATPIQPIEIFGFVTNIVFMVILSKYQRELIRNRNEISQSIFKKMADENKNFLWQLSFFALQRIHIVLLSMIFLVGMNSINVYYIGLLYFIIKFVASTPQYRKSKTSLVTFTAFFIWIPYIWRIISVQFKPEETKPVEGEEAQIQWLTIFFKLMDMVTTLSGHGEMFDGQETYNSYMEVPVPFGQWAVLMLTVFLQNINSMFITKTNKSDQTQLISEGYTLINDHKQTSTTTVDHDADYYEERIGKTLTKKFPTLAKIFIRIQVILGEMLILVILIVQSMTLAFQKSSLMYWLFLILSLILQAYVVSSTYGYSARPEIKKTEEEDAPKVEIVKSKTQVNVEKQIRIKKGNKDNLTQEQNSYKKFVLFSRFLRQYSGLVLIVQIAYHFINDPKFLKDQGLGFDGTLDQILKDLGLDEYMTIIGFSTYDNENQQNLAWIFLSPIIFFITASILKDHFQDKNRTHMEEIRNIENKLVSLNEELESVRDQPSDDEDDKQNPKFETQTTTKATAIFDFNKSVSKNTLAGQAPVNNALQWDEKDEIIYNYEHTRFSVQYLIYQRINQWKIMDTLALNFHLVTALFTVILCTQWQVSLFMYLQLICSVVMCFRVSHAMYKYGRSFKHDNQYKGLQGVKSSRENIEKEMFKKEYITIDDAYAMNKSYNLHASEELMKVRQTNWYLQYWMLIASMILMYPTPLLTDLAATNQGNAVMQEKISVARFWLFWLGIYVAPNGDAHQPTSNGPLYVLITILILDKITQGWQSNRYGCTLSKISEFKHLEEKRRLVLDGSKSFKPMYKFSDIKELGKEDGEYMTVMEAKTECLRIQSLYREQTREIKEERIKEELILNLKRKYITEFRYAIKFLMEQASIQLLLFSSAAKANLVGIIYLALLLTMLVVKKKSTGMRYILYAIGANMIFEYLMTLTNLTFANSPMPFPQEYSYYPCQGAFTNGTLTNIGAEVVTCPVESQKFFFPWFMRVESLRTNLDWAMFLSIAVQHYKIHDLWFDFANLLLMSLYFFRFGNQSKVLQSKVSFSKTSRLEKLLRKFTVYQKENKDALVGKLTKGTDNSALGVSSNKDIDSNKKNPLIDEREIFLGPTYYLAMLKKKIFIYNFTKKMKQFTFVGVQILTAVMIFILAILHRSMMSLFYMIFCIALFWNMKDFFYQEKLRNGKKWPNKYIVEKPLLFLCFIDVAMQIFYQSPFMPAQSGDNARYLGFDKIYRDGHVNDLGLLRPAPGNQYISFLEVQNLYFFMVKAMNFFFILLQSRIYDSEGFSKFMRVDLRSLMNMGMNFKCMIMTYAYNNQKIQDIIKTQQKKKIMYENLTELKDIVRVYQRHQNSLLRGYDPRPTFETQASMNNSNKTPLIGKNQEEKSITEQINFNRQLTNQQKLLNQKSDALDQLNKEFDMDKLYVLNEEDPNYELKSKIYEKARKKLGRCARLYLWINGNYVNQVFFVDSIDEAKKMKENCAKGLFKSSNDLQSAMKRDINLIVEARLFKAKNTQQKVKKGQEYQILLEDMPETSEFIKINRLIVAVIDSIPNALLSQSAALSYFFMILSMILNAGLVSILYPFGVFGYALMEEGRPGKKFWNMMSAYTIFILFMKLIVQLDIWYAIGIDQAYYYVNSYIILGLYRTEGIIELFGYIFPEFMVLTFIWAQQFYEILVGLHDDREIQVEDIQQARERFMNQFNLQAKKIMTETIKASGKLQQANQSNAIDVAEELPGTDGLTYEQRSNFYLEELKGIKQKQQETKGLIARPKGAKKCEEDFTAFIAKDGERQELEEFVNQKTSELSRENHSLIINTDDIKVAVRGIKEKKRSKIQRLVKSMSSSNYFTSLFPLIKEQKPGKDYYARITFWQFIICIYLINYYTDLDARGTQILENTNQFSIYMVMMLFFQVAVMIIERFISRTNTRVHRRGEDVQKYLTGNKLTGTLTNTQGGSTLAAQTMKMTQKTNKRSISSVTGTFKGTSEGDEYTKLQQYTQLTMTKMTFQQALKYIVQIVLLVMYHFVIFWLFPISSNHAIYGEPRCNHLNENTFRKYGCYDFKSNWSLIVFYMIFCAYFTLSALQIRYGYPDWKDPSSLTRSYGLGPYLGNMIFYNIPLMLEFKTILDWCFTKTSLDIFQWLELAEINNQLYNATNGNPGLYKRKLGTRVSVFEKRLCGCFCTWLMLGLLVFPFLFFSNLRYIAAENPVTDASLGVIVKIHQHMNDGSSPMHYEFPLFKTSSPLRIYGINETQFEAKQYGQRPETKFFDPVQVQIIQYKSQSDEMWQASMQYRYFFRDLLAAAANDTENISIEAVFQYEFYRALPLTATQAWGNRTVSVNPSGFSKFLEIDCMDPAQAHANVTINLEQLLPSRVRLDQSTIVQPLIIDDEAYKNWHNVDLEYSCQNYWMLNEENTSAEDGIQVQVFSDIISEGFFEATSITAFYLGTTLAVGAILRTIMLYKTDRIFICDARDPTLIRNLISCLYRQRLEENLKREEELFFLLFEILRSPELFKHITGSSLRVDLEEEAAQAYARHAVENKA